MTSLSDVQIQVKADAESALAEIIADRSLTRPHELASNMSKREFFAAQAITGMATTSLGDISANGYDAWVEDQTKRAVDIADALIEALNATNTPDQCRTADAE